MATVMDLPAPVLYAHGVPGWMTTPELVWLSRTAAAQPPGAVWCEVGSWMGRSWSCVALSLPQNSSIIAVDTFMGEDSEPLQFVKEHGSALPHFMRVWHDVRRQRPDLTTPIVEKLSVPGAGDVPDEFCDVIFIDANHKEEFVRADFAAWLPKLKPGGLFCGHDIHEKGVRAALAAHPYRFDPDQSGGIWWLV